MKIVPYDPKYKDDFARLNTEWLTKLYYIESYDQYAIDHVEEPRKSVFADYVQQMRWVHQAVEHYV